MEQVSVRQRVPKSPSIFTGQSLTGVYQIIPPSFLILTNPGFQMVVNYGYEHNRCGLHRVGVYTMVNGSTKVNPNRQLAGFFNKARTQLALGSQFSKLCV